MRKFLIYRLAAVTALCSVLMTGCSKRIDITNEQNDIIANYAARLVVKATKVDYLYIPDIKEAQTDADENGEETQETQTDAEGNVIAAGHDYSTLSEYLDMNGIEISYKGYVLGTEYPNDDEALFVIEAEPGKQLLAVEYNLTNVTDGDITYSAPEERPVFSLKTGSKRVMSFRTLLLNDLSNMKDFLIGAGQTKTAVIVFRIDADDVENLSSIEVRYGEGGSSLPTEKR